MAPAFPLQSLLLAVPIVIVACQIGGWVARRLGQPPVIGEIAAGIALGPSLLGWQAPELQQQVLPAHVLPTTSALGAIGLLAFLFLIGFELDLPALRGARRALVGVAAGSIVVPGLLGTVLGMLLYSRFAPAGVDRAPFVLFVAVAVGITAFPVLARILSDRNLERTVLGSFVMLAAGANDVVAWCLLTAVVALSASGSALEVVGVAALAAAISVLLIVTRPVLSRAIARLGRSSDELVLVALCAGLLLSSYATDRIGVHPAFGAFLFGAVAPRGLASVERSAARIRAVIVPLLLPLYFVDVGLHTDLTALSWGQWGWAVVVVAVAVAGKLIGAAGAARLTGCTWQWAAAVGILMNCRGLTELIVLGIGRDIGVISAELFAIFVVMAILTTLATAPLLGVLVGRHPGVVHSPTGTGEDPRPVSSEARPDAPGRSKTAGRGVLRSSAGSPGSSTPG